MSNSKTSGTDFGLNGDWSDLPDSLENRLAASQYLVEVGLAGGPLEDIAYRLTVKLAAERKAAKDQYDALTCEVRKHKERWKRERIISNGLADDLAELEEAHELLEAESDLNLSAMKTCQERLDNALSTVDTLAQGIDWDALLTNGDNE